jgi:hypothetical protein
MQFSPSLFNKTSPYLSSFAVSKGKFTILSVRKLIIDHNWGFEAIDVEV